MAERLGRPFMPWQQLVADVVLEVDPDTGRLVYDEFGLTVPRQSGKSTWILAKVVQRGNATKFFGRRQRMVYTAQTRNKAREKWEEDYVEDLKASPTFGPRVHVHLGNGNEHIKFPNGSRFGIEANTDKAGHGSTLDEAYIDEAFSQVDNRLEQAFRPAMITRPNTQLGWVSTAGWLDGSPFLEAKVRRGRDAVAAGKQSGLAYFEWSAHEGSERDDPKVWRSCMPALGHTITEAAIRAELEAMADNLADFDRAYLNIWVPRQVSTTTVIDMELWAKRYEEQPEKAVAVTLAVDVTPDRSSGSVGFAGRMPDGTKHVEVIENKSGTGWIVAMVAEHLAQRPEALVRIDPSGPAGSLIPEFQNAGIELDIVSTKDMAQACGAFYDGVINGTISHFDQPALNSALGAARKRSLGDAWAWHRKDSTDISPLVVVTLAAAGLDKPPKKKRSGKVW